MLDFIIRIIIHASCSSRQVAGLDWWYCMPILFLFLRMFAWLMLCRHFSLVHLFPCWCLVFYVVLVSSYICVVFPSLYVVCWSFCLCVVDFNCICHHAGSCIGGMDRIWHRIRWQPYRYMLCQALFDGIIQKVWIVIALDYTCIPMYILNASSECHRSW